MITEQECIMNKNDNIYSREEICQHYIISNINRIQNIIKPYKLQRDALMLSESGVWHIDIQQQYNKILKSVIAVDMAVNIPGLTPLEALLFTEQLNIEELL